MKRLLLLIGLLFLLPVTAYAQSTTATPHGILVKWSAVSEVPNGNPVSGYQVFRCTPGNGTCSTTTPICATPATEPCWAIVSPAIVTGTSWLDPSTDAALTDGTTFAFAAETFDVTGENSNLSNISTVAVPSTGFPVAPQAPSLTSATVQ